MIQPPDFSKLPPSPATYKYPGAKWWRVDFHTHTPESDDYANRAGSKKEELKSQSAQNWLLKQMSWGIDAVVITDHNTTGFIANLQEAYSEMLGDNSVEGFRPITIFPGFELSVNGGLHLLGVFDPESDLEDVSSVIRACKYEGTRGKTDGITEKSYQACVKAIKEAGGITIAAHIDDPCGILWSNFGSQGRSIRNLMQNEGVSRSEAIEKLIDAGEIPENSREYKGSICESVKSILKSGLDAIEVLSWSSLPEDIRNDPKLGRLSRVIGSDSHMPREIGRNGFSLVHMSEPNLEGLRLAFADGAPLEGEESWSVRSIEADDPKDYNAWPDYALSKLSIKDLKVMGRAERLELPFHPRFNVIVGSRGSGKSTIVHSIRHVTDRGRELPRFTDNNTPVSESPAGDFGRWARTPTPDNSDGVFLKSEQEKSEITLDVRTPIQSARVSWDISLHNDERSFLVGDIGEIARDEGGKYFKDRCPVSIYSQKHILEISRGTAGSGLVSIIDREQKISEVEEELEKKVNQYKTLKSSIREKQNTLAKEEEDRSTLKDKEKEIGRLQSEEAILYQLREAQARLLLPDLSEDSPLLETGKKIKVDIEAIGLPSLPLELFKEDDLNAQTALRIYEEARDDIANLQKSLKKSLTSYVEILERLSKEVIDSEWNNEREKAKENYEKEWGESSTSQNKNRLEQLLQDKSELLGRIESYNKTHKEVQLLREEAKTLLLEIKKTREHISERREEFISRHNSKGTLLKLELVRMGAEVSSVEKSLRNALGLDATKFSEAINSDKKNSLIRIFEDSENPEQGTQSVKSRVFSLIKGNSEQGFGTFQSNMRRQIENTPQRLEAIETWFPEDRLKLEYRTEKSGKWKSITEGSIGQQNAAILSFLLSFGTEPLIIDQPEDDLDTRMVMNLVVGQVREMKDKRQIIIITHNPNIVIHGDGDLVHAMDNERTKGQVVRLEEASGGLQSESTRKFICDVMEGGDVAFKRRFERMSSGL